VCGAVRCLWGLGAFLHGLLSLPPSVTQSVHSLLGRTQPGGRPVTPRDTLRPLILFVISAAMLSWTVPGTDSDVFRSLLVDGPLPWTALGLALWMAVGFVAGRSRTRAVLLYSLAAILAGSVAGRIIAALLAANIGLPFDSASVAAALTLGFTDPGSMRALGSLGDPVGIRAVAALLLPAVVALGAYAGHFSKRLRPSSVLGAR